MNDFLIFGALAYVFQLFGAVALFAAAAQDKVTDE
jgi:hypothetical protein